MERGFGVQGLKGLVLQTMEEALGISTTLGGYLGLGGSAPLCAARASPNCVALCLSEHFNDDIKNPSTINNKTDNQTLRVTMFNVRNSSNKTTNSLFIIMSIFQVIAIHVYW